MFTGIIEETGTVERIEPVANGIRLAVRAKACARGLKIGDSMAVNGCCLTAVKINRSRIGAVIEFDLLKETWSLTNFQFASIGSLVNLERPLRASGRLDGHFVTGHIDGLGKVRQWKRSKQDWLLGIQADSEIMRYIVLKGSIAVDGISLTVASIQKNEFQVWIIPHTYEVTALRQREVGDRVNLETDILGKYVEQFTAQHGRRSSVRRRSRS